MVRIVLHVRARAELIALCLADVWNKVRFMSFYRFFWSETEMSVASDAQWASK